MEIEPVEASSRFLHRFREEAMATHFEIVLDCDDPEQARGIANECFREVERLENILSRFREGSDVDRINHLSSGESIWISEECHACLIEAFTISALTDGWFDPFTGGFMELVRGEKSLRDNVSAWDLERQLRTNGHLVFDPDHPRVKCDVEGLKVDLGGIGKGFALAEIARLISDLGGPEMPAFVHSGGSTALGIRAPRDSSRGWPVTLSSSKQQHTLHLNNHSISASGTAVQGAHIIIRGQAAESYPHKRVWVQTKNPAVADALSTAVLVMPESSRTAALEHIGDAVSAWAEDKSGDLIPIWPPLSPQ